MEDLVLDQKQAAALRSRVGWACEQTGATNYFAVVSLLRKDGASAQFSIYPNIDNSEPGEQVVTTLSFDEVMKHGCLMEEAIEYQVAALHTMIHHFGMPEEEIVDYFLRRIHKGIEQSKEADRRCREDNP